MGNHEHGSSSGLKVRSRQVFSDCGNPTIALGVQCPERAQHVEMEDCLQCSGFLGLRLDSTRRRLALACDAEHPLPGAAPADVDRKTRSAGRATIESIMTTDVLCVSRELSLGLLARLLLDRGISGAPVVDESGLPIGMVSKTDLVRYYSDERNAGNDTFAVADIMMDLAFCLPASESIAKAAALMAFEGMHRVPVVNARGGVVGLVSALDVLRWMAQMDGYVVGDGSRGSG